MGATPFSSINNVLSSVPPSHLFHYTSSTGLIGIATNKKLWATHVQYTNDAKEFRHAVDNAVLYIENKLRTLPSNSLITSEDVAFLNKMSSYSGAYGDGVYVASLTEMRDQLSQWRAYCSPGSGYAIGFPAKKLKDLATRQGFYLAKCVYEYQLQYQMMAEIVEFHFRTYKKLVVDGVNREDADRRVIPAYMRDIARFGPIVKHEKFEEEKEWRLISAPLAIYHEGLKYRPGARSIVPYCEFSLEDDECTLADPEDLDNSLITVVGPTPTPGPAQMAVQSIMNNSFGGGCGHSMSSVPYRGN